MGTTHGRGPDDGRGTPPGGVADDGASRGPSPVGEGWKLVAGWLVVGIPAAWGVAQVVLKSLALFR